MLPNAVSSVYLFYDPEYAQFDWGKLSAMREIALTIESGYEFYYMGFYIHSCIKMRYKAGFKPSSLLDPESFQWNIFDEEYKAKLDKRKYVSLSGDLKNPPPSAELEPVDPTQLPVEDENMKDTTKARAAVFADDQNLELDEEDSDNEDAEIPEGSLFEYNIPGVLTKSEVAALNLEQWKLVVRNTLIDLEVRSMHPLGSYMLTLSRRIYEVGRTGRSMMPIPSKVSRPSSLPLPVQDY